MSSTKTALITGGGTRIGRYFALILAELGFNIALHYNSSKGEAEQVAEAVRRAGRVCELFHCDFLTDEAESLIARVQTKMEGLSLLINSASVYTPAKISDTSRALIEEQFAVNFIVPFLLTKCFSERVAKGCIINILDNKITMQQSPYAAYSLSKKAFADFNKLAALELAPNIRVNAIAPGVILPASERTSDYLQWRYQGIPMQRQGELEELGLALKYLLSNTFVTGQILFVDGGESINFEGRHSENFPTNKSI